MWKGSLSDWKRLSIAKHDKRTTPTTTRTYFLISSFLTGSLDTATGRTLCPGVGGGSGGRELFDESVTVVGSERQQGELRRLICKNRIMLVHRIKRWAPCFLSAVTEGLHQEVAGVSQATVSTLFHPSTVRGSRRELGSSSVSKAKLQRRPQLPNALETSLTSQREARKEMFKVGLKCGRFQLRTNTF